MEVLLWGMRVFSIRLTGRVCGAGHRFREPREAAPYVKVLQDMAQHSSHGSRPGKRTCAEPAQAPHSGGVRASSATHQHVCTPRCLYFGNFT
jgi:hypothetical protein